MRALFSNSRALAVVLACATVVAAVPLVIQFGNRQSVADDDYDNELSDSRIARGFEISPVELNLQGRNRALVGLGSYLVNAEFGCSDCHTFPQFAPGGNPFLGEEEEINVAGYLAGGRPFGPIISNDLTPDGSGRPAGMSFEEFEFVMRSGVDRDHSFPPVPSPANDLMQVMPWPVFRNMTDRDMRALYEYLGAIPSVP
jgi:hypothetical protein